MLAYSSVSQVGYILLGFSLFTLGGLVATFFYMISHAFLKGLLFLVAGMAQNMHGIKTIKATEGMGYQVPLTMMLFTFAAFGMVGIPGTSGFIAKLQLSLAFMDASRGGFVALIIVSGILNALYFFPIFMKSFFPEEEKVSFKLEKIPFAMGFTLIMMVGIILTLGFYPNLLMPWIEAAADSLLGVS
jgi:multicomponent Na+:H+ antiporter subunit D